MKNNKHLDSALAVGLRLVPVRFEFTDATASTVCVAGTFNHWQPEMETRHAAGIGRWYWDTILAPGAYEYCLIVNGHWMPDPQAKESSPNPFGGRNSILNVGARDAAPSIEAESFSSHQISKEERP
jgi:1,4-alpha-glucan branching enzyme